MNNQALATTQHAPTLPALQMDEAELMGVLRSSLYPGAKDESIKLVLGWCRASGKDPMKRPVHIVPMSVKVGKNPDDTDRYEYRDVLMPGIGDYRIDAARTGEYAGIDEAMFGDDVTEKFGDVEVTYPAWCEIAVYRLVHGIRCRFSSGRVWWKETYATRSRKSTLPNSMWLKRPRGQLEKCAEAMALRRAFPETVGAQPTAEEMEGRVVDVEAIEHTGIQQPRAIATQPEQPSAGSVESAGNQPAEVQKEAPKNAAPIGENQMRVIRAALKSSDKKEEDLCKAFGVAALDKLTMDKMNDAMTYAKRKD